MWQNWFRMCQLQCLAMWQFYHQQCKLAQGVFLCRDCPWVGFLDVCDRSLQAIHRAGKASAVTTPLALSLATVRPALSSSWGCTWAMSAAYCASFSYPCCWLYFTYLAKLKALKKLFAMNAPPVSEAKYNPYCSYGARILKVSAKKKLYRGAPVLSSSCSPASL